MFELSLQDQVAIVTGAGRGIGRAPAHAIARAGASVALASRTQDELERVADEVRALGGRALVVPTDAADPSAMQALVDRTVAELGTLDIMVNNAGVAPFLASFMDTRPDGFEKYFGINFWSAVYGTRAAGAVLLEKGSGCVLNLASIDAITVEPGLSYYGAAKAAIVNLTRVTALEWTRSGVRVNALAPGWIDTPMNAPERSDPEAERKVLAAIPLGEVLVIDGGQTISSAGGERA